VIVSEAISWLKTLKPDQPFCLFAWFHSTHEPIATAPDFVKPYAGIAKTDNQAQYFGNVTQLDHEIGRLLASLDDLKRADNTLTFFTSDNGPEGLKRYERADRSYGSAGHFRASKLHLYEGGLRVPGILRWPAKVRAGQTVSTPIINLDLLPTFCSLAAAPLPKNRPLDGVDATPLLHNQPLARPQPLFWAYDKAVGGPTVALRDGDFKLLATPNFTRFEMYNLKDDPSESNDLAAKDPARLKHLSDRMRTLYADVQSARPVWPATQTAP
jgi:arylsulfatase A